MGRVLEAAKVFRVRGTNFSSPPAKPMEWGLEATKSSSYRGFARQLTASEADGMGVGVCKVIPLSRVPSSWHRQMDVDLFRQ